MFVLFDAAHGHARSSRHAALAWLAAVSALAACNGEIPTAPTMLPIPDAAAAFAPEVGVDVYVHAHADDWQLFMGDRVNASVQGGRGVVLVYATAGDAGGAEAYWQAREAGSRASVDAITPAGPWACGAQTVNAHNVLRCAKGDVVSYYMRLPDGNLNGGQGFGRGSLVLLQNERGPLAAVDGSTTYASWADFTATVGAIVDLEAGGRNAPSLAVHAPDHDRAINLNDHPDHWATADAVRAASASRSWLLSWYVDYETQWMTPNLTTADSVAKRREFLAYDRLVAAAGYETYATHPSYNAWLQRTYVRTQVSNPPSRAPQTASVAVTGMPATPQLYGTTFTVGATGGSGTGAYRFAATGACSAVATTGAVTMTSGTGTCSVTAVRAGDASFLESPPSDAASVAASKIAQAAIALTGMPTSLQPYNATFLVAATGGTGTGAVTFGVLSGSACSVNSTTGLVQITKGSGSCSVRATQAADANYNAVTSPYVSVGATKAVQPTAVTVTRMPTTPQPNGATFTVRATGGNGTGAYGYVADGACSVGATTGAVTMTSGTGSCSVTAARAGDANYLASPTSARVAVAAAVAPGRLAARGYLVSGRQRADLAWTVGSEARVDIYRGTTRIASNVPNTGTRTDAINQTGSGTYAYKVCMTGKTVAVACSNTITVTF